MTCKSSIYIISRSIIGIILFLGGINKVFSPKHIIITEWLILNEWATFSVGLAELLMSLFALSFYPSSFINRLLTVQFIIYTIALIMQLISGETRCQCFGGEGLSIYFMLFLDVSNISLLLYLSSQWSKFQENNKTPLIDLVVYLSFLIPPFLIAMHLWLGSPDVVYGLLVGDPIISNHKIQYGGELKPGAYSDIIYSIINNTSAPITITGRLASCSCIALLDSVITLPPGKGTDVTVRVFAKKDAGIQTESVYLLFNDSAYTLRLYATVVIRPDR